MEHRTLRRAASRLHSVSRKAGKRSLGYILHRLPISLPLHAQIWRTWTEFGLVERKNTRLDSATLKLCREYAADNFGEDDKYAIELAIYCSIHGSWREGWIPESYFQKVMVYQTSGVPTLSREKTLSNFFLRTDALPDIAYLCHGRFFTREWDRIENGHLADFLFSGRERIAFKTNASYRGRGVTILSRQDCNPDMIARMGDGCFQSFIQVSSSVPFHELSAVPTLRIVTTMTPNGIVKPRLSHLRIGMIGQTHIETDNTIKVPVDMQTGKLYPKGFLTDWTSITEHPETKVKFDGLIYPMFQEGMSLCVSRHTQLPCFLSIGWDICLNEAGKFEIMEWNQLHGIQLGEAVSGPNFTDLGLGRRLAARI